MKIDKKTKQTGNKHKLTDYIFWSQKGDRFLTPYHPRKIKSNQVRFKVKLNATKKKGVIPG